MPTLPELPPSLIGLLVVFFIFVFVLKLSNKSQGYKTKTQTSKEEKELQPLYDKSEVLFSPAERSFFGVLEQALGEGYRIFGKVRLADVICVRKGFSRSEWQKAFNQIQSKHLDFVVCDKNQLGICFAVELDDKSHAKTSRQTRDLFVESALEEAGVPLYRFPARQTYSVQDIQNQIFGPQKEAGHDVSMIGDIGV